jgi:hypothetical protein
MVGCGIGSRNFLHIPEVVSCGDNSIWRYVMESDDGDGVLDISCLDILPKDEGYLSFYHSDKVPNDDFVIKVRHINSLVRFKKTNPALFLKFDVVEALESTENRTDFFDAGYPHIGMQYPQVNDLNSLELKTILIEISDIYQRSHGGDVIKLL